MTGCPSMLMTPVASLRGADVSTLVAVLSGLVVVPLGAITFYIRAVREQQAAGRAEFTRRFEHVESAIRRIARRLSEHERDFTVKEDWLRESMLARQNLERLTEAFARLEGGVESMLDRPPRTACSRRCRAARPPKRPRTGRDARTCEQETD